MRRNLLRGALRARTQDIRHGEGLDDPDGEYVDVDVEPPSGLGHHAGFATIPLDVVLGAAARNGSAVRLQNGRPGSWRVTLGTPTFQNLPVPQIVNGVPNIGWNVNPALAIVEWGLGAAFFQAEIDWRKGCSFVVSAENINVSVLALNLTGVPPTPNEGVAQFPAIIAPAETLSPPAAPPSRTFFTGNLNPAPGPGNTFLIPVPPFARTWRMWRVAGDVLGSTQVLWLANAALTQAVGQYQSLNSSSRVLWDVNATYAVPPQAMLLQISNLDAVTAASWMVEFGLDLG